jgi:acyl-CoA hydrolase
VPTENDEGRPVAASVVEMTEIVLPEDTNPRGHIFGGRVLALVDKCAAVVAMRHARTEVVTAALDSVDFRSGAHTGDILVLHGRLNAAFASSMEIEVEVHAEHPEVGSRRLTTRAFVTMVAVDATGRPCPVPRLRLDVEAEIERAREASERRRDRLARRR